MAEAYREVRTIEHDGVCCTITCRLSNLRIPQYSYRFFRKYLVGEEAKSTPWLSPRHSKAVVELTGIIANIIREEQESA